MGISRRKRWKNFAKTLWREMLADNIFDGAGVFAFFSMLAIFPAAIFVLTLVPYLSIPHLQKTILDLLHQVLPTQSSRYLDRTVRYALTRGKGGLLTFGLLFFLWSGSAGTASFMQQLNIVCNVTERRPMWKSRGLAVLLMLFFGVLSILSLSLVIFGGIVQSWAASVVGSNEALRVVFVIGRWLVLIAAQLLTIAVLYRFGPDAPTTFRFIAPGNVTAAALIALVSWGFQFYVSHFGDYSAIYGSLSAIIILMMWIYLVGVSLLIGCEIDTILYLLPMQRPGFTDTWLFNPPENTPQNESSRQKAPSRQQD